jgi:hypothetical protein
MKKVVFLLSILTIAILGFGQGSNIEGLLTYSILEDKVSDTEIKTQVKIKLLITGKNMTEQRIRELLTDLYQKTIKRTGFKYSTHPTNVFIYAFTSKEKSESGTQWIGMIAKTYSQSNPTISISDTQMKSLTLKPENKFGLTEKVRMEIFRESIKCRQRAQKEATAKYPQTDPNTALVEAEKWNALSDKVKANCLNELAKKYGITLSTIDSIQDEGFDKGWTVPSI